MGQKHLRNASDRAQVRMECRRTVLPALAAVLRVLRYFLRLYLVVVETIPTSGIPSLPDEGLRDIVAQPLEFRVVRNRLPAPTADDLTVLDLSKGVGPEVRDLLKPVDVPDETNELTGEERSDAANLREKLAVDGIVGCGFLDATPLHVFGLLYQLRTRQWAADKVRRDLVDVRNGDAPVDHPDSGLLHGVVVVHSETQQGRVQFLRRRIGVRLIRDRSTFLSCAANASRVGTDSKMCFIASLARNPRLGLIIFLAFHSSPPPFRGVERITRTSS